MYRNPGSAGVLTGVLSGPYAGSARIVDAAKLPRAGRQRLADVLTGRAEPTPILHESPTGLASRFRASWGVLLAIIALATLTGIGFADPRASWAYQPRGAIAGYAAGAMLLTYSVLALHRRRALASGRALVPGRYLLPLDVVEVPPADAAGDQRIVVTPLGSARDARVHEADAKTELIIVLDGGGMIRFALRSEREGEHALRRLEHAQSLLEELTYSPHLEKALAHDAFFDVRVDDSWEAVSPSGPQSRKSRQRRAFLHGSLATACVLAVGGALGWAAFVGRNWASDRALYLRALRIGTIESLDAYLVRGTSHHLDADIMRDRLVAQRTELAARAAESQSQSASRGFDGVRRAESELTPEEARARSGLAEACEAQLRARAAPAHPEVTPIMEGFVRRGRATGNAVVPVRIDARSGDVPAGVPASDPFPWGEVTISEFERVFSHVCPASLVKLVPQHPARAVAEEPGLDVKIEITWPKAPTWMLKADPDHYACGPSPTDFRPDLACPPGGRVAVHAPTFVFEVRLRGIDPGPVGSFRLTVPPPPQPPLAARERSVFAPIGLAQRGAYDPNLYPLLMARAFDRLYDEVYGLFFRGDPEVPLRGDEP